MNTKDRTTYDAMRRARGFVRRYGASLGWVAAAPARNALDNAIRLVGQWTLWRWVTALMDEGLRTSILTLRHTLRVEAMRPVITIARERLRDEIELHALGLPKRHANGASFILTCNLLADVVMRHQRAFEREGLPKDTARRLREGATKLSVLTAKRATVRASRAMWRRKIDDQLQRARGDLAVLDALGARGTQDESTARGGVGGDEARNRPGRAGVSRAQERIASMRPLIPFALWLGALVLPVPEAIAADSTTALLTTVATLAGLIVMVYRLGVWRQEMHNTKYNVGAEISRYREETNQHFERFDRRFDSIDQHIAAATEQRVASERWRARVNTTLTGHDRDFVGVGVRLERLEGLPRSEAA